jgi:hypothetical protein
MMKVQIGGDVVRRVGEVEVIARDHTGRPTISRMRPQLYPGEVLVERIGTFPAIVRAEA